MTENVRMQNLREFTVQIRRADTDEIVGTGIAVSTDGKIVTCRHVVEAAGVDLRNADGAQVGVYFPQLRGGEQKQRAACIEKFFAEYDDDVVLLRLTGPSPLAPEQIAVLGTADLSERHPFQTYGYSQIGAYPALRGEGFILGSIECPLDRTLQVDPIQLKSREIAAGMSGAAVLDVTRNLVVGLVAERYYPAGAVQDDLGFGVDSKVLTFDPFDFELRGEALALKPAPVPKPDEETAKEVIQTAQTVIEERVVSKKIAWNQAPQVLHEWVGRADLLAALTQDWLDAGKHVTGLIGFGGEGKSSLARKWMDDLLNTPSLLQPDGVFWWSFSENRSVDEFLEEALAYLTDGKIKSTAFDSAYLRVQVIGAMLNAGRFLFILDGLETLQYQDGDEFGLLQNTNVRDLLTFFARPENLSFCLVTSRVPLLDLMNYTTYTHRDLDRLSSEDGRALLQKFGVKPSSAGRGQGEGELDKIVADWDGHALTLSLLGAYIRDVLDGDLDDLTDINLPIEGTPRFENVRHILEAYDEMLSMAERAFLMLLSLFYEPMRAAVLTDFIREKDYPASLCEPIARLSVEKYQAMLEKLQRAHLLRFSPAEQTYSAHALVKAYYAHVLREEDLGDYRDAIEDIANYYGRLAREGQRPVEKLSDLKPQMDAMSYYCRCGLYDDAYNIYWERIDQKEEFFIIHQLCAYDTALSLMSEFFPDCDTSQKPHVSEEQSESFILTTIGFCLMHLGHLREAAPFFERVLTSCLNVQSWSDASRSCGNLSALYCWLGTLEAGAIAISQGIDLARRAKNKNDERLFLAHQAQFESLIGHLGIATNLFKEAEQLLDEPTESVEYLAGTPGIVYCDHLRRIGQSNYSYLINEHNLQICKKNHWHSLTSQCYRIFGDLNATSGDYATIRAYYETALKIARGISFRAVLIEALLARGMFYAKYGAVGTGSPRPGSSRPGSSRPGLPDPKIGQGDPAPTTTDAFNDLNEALDYCVEGGYRIYEADVRVALSWAWLANGEAQKAKESAARALQMSEEMGYYWGKLDAEEVLERVENRE